MAGERRGGGVAGGSAHGVFERGAVLLEAEAAEQGVDPGHAHLGGGKGVGVGVRVEVGVGFRVGAWVGVRVRVGVVAGVRVGVGVKVTAPTSW